MSLPVPSELTANVGDLLAAANWNSNVRDAINFLLNEPSFSVHLATAQSIPNGAATPIAWDTVDEDNYSGYSIGSKTYTVPAGAGGRWIFASSLQWASNAAGSRAMELAGPNIATWTWISASMDADGRMSTLWLGRLAAGAAVYVSGYQTSGGALSTGTGPAGMYFSGQRLGN